MLDALLERFRRRDRLALARLLSLIARGQHVQEFLTALGPVPKRSRVVAITGSGGVGKSTLIGKLIEPIRRDGQTVAVLACDPQSPLSGGALLGDRFRMPSQPDEGVFIRSLATASGRGTVAEHLDAMVRLLEAYGFDVVLVETVGAGQGDTAVRDVVDVVVLLLQPETGDDLQWEKAGILEVADIVVLQKADLPGAERVEAQVRAALGWSAAEPVPVLRVSAKTGEGIEALWHAIAACPARRHTPGLPPDPSRSGEPSRTSPARLPVGLCAQLACIWETTARNPGNAHRFRDFSDATYVDFLSSAAAVAGMLETAWLRPVGQTVLQGVEATRRVVTVNTNLGILLLLAPLAAVPAGEALRTGVDRVLSRLDLADTRAVYQAIRLAAPAGLGRVPEQDIEDEPTQTLRQVMALAAERDLVARQYANGFREVFDDGLSALRRGLELASSLEGAIVFCHLQLMARHPDSLIARKRGLAEAEEAARRAQQVVEAGWPGSAAGRTALADVDAWLRAAGRGRNAGTTADLVTASLFVALREGIMEVPSRYSWSADEIEPPEPTS
jgi:triphosphoribosyl-dephospho-CoA synthase